METQFLASQLEERVKDKDEAMKERDKMGEQLRRKLEEVSQEKTAADQVHTSITMTTHRLTNF